MAINPGTALADKIDGTIDADTINGAAGDDTLSGLGGNDTVSGDDGNDRINITSGIDTVDGGAGIDSLNIDYSAENIGALEIDLRNAFSGGAGTITGANVAGTITAFEQLVGLSGSLGNDTVYLGDATTGFTINLYAGNDKFTGGANAVVVDGGDGNDTLVGSDGADRLIGGAGIDRLDGGLGADELNGGTGNDTYFVNDTLDVITEVDNGQSGGLDVVNATASYTLSAFVEQLKLGGTAAINGTGNALNNRMTGNAGANALDGAGGNDALFGMGGADTLNGGAGADTLDGGAGADTMVGGAGNDTYIVDSASDVVTESNAGGTDLVRSKASYQLANFVEKLTLTGTSAINGTGNSLANVITGNGGANVLSGLGGNDTIAGGGGNDRLIGGAGADRLTGGAGADVFVFDTLQSGANRDIIVDFKGAADDIAISKAAFGAFGTDALGALSSSRFVVGKEATTAQQRLVYDSGTGNLYYDADGSGTAQSQVQIAKFSNLATLSASDFHLV